MNRFALLVTAIDGEIDPAVLADNAPRSPRRQPGELNRWLYAVPTPQGNFPLSVGRRPRASGAHDAAIHSFCLWFDKPFTWEGLNATLQALTALRGPDLLRVKGIVHVAGEPGPVVLQR